MSDPVLTRARLVGRPGKMTSRLNASALLLELFGAFFGTLGAVGLNTGHRSGAWIVGALVMVWCLLALGLARSPAGVVAGAVTQVVLVVVGLRIDLGVWAALLLAAVWVWLVWIGLRIDRDRAAWARAEAASR